MQASNLLVVINQVRKEGDYPILDTIRNEDLVSEWNFIAEAGIKFIWADKYWQAYRNLSRIGRPFGLNRQQRGNLFAAFVAIQNANVANIREARKQIAKNSQPLTVRLENQILGDIEQI